MARIPSKCPFVPALAGGQQPEQTYQSNGVRQFGVSAVGRLLGLLPMLALSYVLFLFLPGFLDPGQISAALK